MYKHILLLVLLLVAAFTVDARRNRNERVPKNQKGDPCAVMCPAKDGWDRCEIVKDRDTVSVKCTDSRPDPPPSKGPSFRGPVRG